jgi:hypothetical protein
MKSKFRLQLFLTKKIENRKTKFRWQKKRKSKTENRKSNAPLLSSDGAVMFFTPLVHSPALLKHLSMGAEVEGAARWFNADFRSGI